LLAPEYGPLREKLNKQKTTAKFIEQTKSVHGDLYDYSRSIYSGGTTRVTIICKKHRECEQQPSNHIGNGADCYE